MDFSSPFSSPHNDICLEILTRLDAKSVSRLKLVSKDWYIFLSHPSFAKLYSKKRPSISAFFHQTSTKYQEKIQYVPIDPNQEYIADPPSCLGFLDDPAILYNSCNGLIHWYTLWDRQHFISNPLIQKSVPFTWLFSNPEFFACGIAFDPSVSEHFEIVVFVQSLVAGTNSICFSSEKMEWGVEKETIVVRGTTAPPYCPNRGVFLSGVLYWELKNNTLLAYNVKDRIDWLIDLPVKNLTEKIEFVVPGCLGESKRRLHYCRLMGTALCVWAKTEDHSSGISTTSCWILLHCVNLRQADGPQALAFLDDDCRRVLVGVKHKIIAYCLSDDSVQEVCKMRRNGDTLPYVQPSMFFPFVHTLALSNFP